MPMRHTDNWGAGPWLLAGLLCLAVIVVLVWTVARLLAVDSRPSSRATALRATPESPEKVLALRYARGELDAAEYRERLLTLRVESSADDGWSPGRATRS